MADLESNNKAVISIRKAFRGKDVEPEKPEKPKEPEKPESPGKVILPTLAERISQGLKKLQGSDSTSDTVITDTEKPEKSEKPEKPTKPEKKK
jgi:hypothetical protein